eukprot:1323568-Alexandrium_andersonii.AAC.1
MSASLVGSEMCIRDSLDSRRFEASIPGTSRLRGIEASRRLETSRGLDSVSYTHLTLPTICSV